MAKIFKRIFIFSSSQAYQLFHDRIKIIYKDIILHSVIILSEYAAETRCKFNAESSYILMKTKSCFRILVGV